MMQVFVNLSKRSVTNFTIRVGRNTPDLIRMSCLTRFHTRLNDHVDQMVQTKAVFLNVVLFSS